MTKKQRFNTSLQVVILIGVVLVLNLISSNVFRRIDLTEDQRFTVSDVSAEMLANLSEPVFINVYYGGDLPTYYKNFELEMEDFLEELHLNSNGMLDYEFVNPEEDPTIFKRFAEKGLWSFPLSASTSFTSQKESRVLPWAEITYGVDGRSMFVNLIHNATFPRQQDGQPDFSVSIAMQRFEYNIMTSIYNLSREKFKTVGILTGHGEYRLEAMSDLARSINPYYNFVEVDLRGGKQIGPENLDLLLVLQPDTLLSTRELYEIDQYLMRGGKAIFTMDTRKIDWRLGEQVSTWSFNRKTGIDELLLKQGIKLNYDLVKDVTCGRISTTSYTAAFGDEKQLKIWPFFPIIRIFSSHPTTRYISRAMVRYGSTIDTTNVEGISKTVLFKSTPRSWVKEGEQFINLTMETQKTKEEQEYELREFYVDGPQIMGVLAEGKFQSAFRNRPVPPPSNFSPAQDAAFLPEARPGADPRLVLISDGEFAVGDFRQGKYLPLPEENATLMMNLIDFMTGQDIVTKLRPRNQIERMLVRDKIIGNEFSIRLINIGIPIALILAIGFVRFQLRRRRNKRRVEETKARMNA